MTAAATTTDSTATSLLVFLCRMDGDQTADRDAAADAHAHGQQQQYSRTAKKCFRVLRRFSPASD